MIELLISYCVCTPCIQCAHISHSQWILKFARNADIHVCKFLDTCMNAPYTHAGYISQWLSLLCASICGINGVSVFGFFLHHLHVLSVFRLLQFRHGCVFLYVCMCVEHENWKMCGSFAGFNWSSSDKYVSYAPWNLKVFLLCTECTLVSFIVVPSSKMAPYSILLMLWKYVARVSFGVRVSFFIFILAEQSSILYAFVNDAISTFIFAITKLFVARGNIPKYCIQCTVYSYLSCQMTWMESKNFVIFVVHPILKSQITNSWHHFLLK